MGKIVDLTGEKFGRLTVLSKAVHLVGSRAKHWHCQCVCGNAVMVREASLRNGYTASCGCVSTKISNAQRRIIAAKSLSDLDHYLNAEPLVDDIDDVIGGSAF